MKMFISGEHGAANFHTTGRNPNIVNGDFASFFNEMEVY
jgi:hypothetical protein